MFSKLCVKDATVSDLIAPNKVVKFIQNITTCIHIPTFDIEWLNIKLYSDASFNNLLNSSNQGGFIILLSDNYNNVARIAWSPIKLQRFARSTMAAETLALSDSCDTSYFVASLKKEMIFMKQHNDINIEAFTDNCSLCETLHTTKPILDKHHQVEIIYIQIDQSMADRDNNNHMLLHSSCQQRPKKEREEIFNIP